MAALLGAAAAGAALFAALRWGTPAGPAAPAPGGADVAGAASSEAAARLIELRISAAPATARIFLDDVVVPSNPFAAKFPRDGTGHRIRVEAEGHAPEARLVVFERDVALDVALARADAAVTALPVPPLRPGKPAGSDGVRRPAPPETGAAPPSSAGTATGAPRGPKVDTSDPWAAKP
jgi:serine/threonine-protein kinase